MFLGVSRKICSIWVNVIELYVTAWYLINILLTNNIKFYSLKVTKYEIT